MNIKASLLLALGLSVASFAAAADKTVAGPRGGRLLETTPQQAEFFVTPERKAEIRFVDAALKPVAPGNRVVTLIAEPASGRQPIALEKTAEGFASAQALPPGEPYRLVVQVRETTDAKPQNFRVMLNLANCAECQHAEYACTCGH